MTGKRDELYASPEERLGDLFTYLDDLRSSGATNMWGARAYLQFFMDCDSIEARSALTQWMATFDPSVTPEDRARQALSQALGEGT